MANHSTKMWVDAKWIGWGGKIPVYRVVVHDCVSLMVVYGIIS